MSEVWRIGVVMAASLAAAACSKSEPAPVAEPARTASASSTPASVVTVNAAPSAESSASAAPAPTMVAPREAMPAAPVKLHLVIEAQGGLTFIGGAGGGLLVETESAWALEIRGDTLVPAYGFAAGLSEYRGNNKRGNLESFGGRYPKHVHAVVGAYAPRGTTDHVVHQWRGGASWSAVGSSGNDMSSVTAVEPYQDGFAISVQRLAGGVDLEASGGKRFKPRPADKSAQCPTRIAMVTDLVAPVAGGLIAIGTDCNAGGDAIEIFGDDGASKGFQALPPDLGEMRIAALSTSEIYLAGVPAAPKAKPSPSASASASAAPQPGAGASLPIGKPVLLALQNGAWVPKPMPSEERIASLAASPDGSLVAAAGGSVWRRPRGGAWTAVALPEGASVNYVVAGSASDLWAVDQQRTSLKVYGAKPPRWPFVIGAPTGEAPKAVPATAGCDSPFVLMYTVNPSTAGTDYDFPLTRAALKGHTELAGTAVVLTEHWQLGAYVPSIEMGEKVAGLIRDNVKGQKPQVICAKPRVRVEVPINLETGELRR